MTGTARARTPRRALRAAAAALVLALGAAAPAGLAACGGETPTAPVGSPHITGTVRSASLPAVGTAVGSFLVDPGAGDYDKAMVTVTADTAWYRSAGGTVTPLEPPGVTALTGRRVAVRFTGAVAESYPVQATAAWVIVYE